MNTDSALDEAILHSELRHIKFFNGRLLTGGDLEEEQSAQHAHSHHLGEAIGEGVAFGLQVTPVPASSPPAGPVVAISKGLAVNRAGQTLRLECDKRVALTRPADPAARDACIFTDCAPPSPGTTLASGTGYYVLTIGPASRPDGKAPVSGLGNTTAICNSRYSAEGVKFSVFPLNLPGNATPLARSVLAQACFGLAPDISSGGWPGSLPVEYGWEKLVPPGFERDYHVPLAVFEWTNAKTIGFVKQWPVRRRMVRPSAVEQWAYFTSERRVAEGEAMFLDFQEDLAAVAPSGFAGSRFSLLPAGGILPTATTWRSFLGPLAPRFATPIDASLWPRLLRDTFTREPIAIPAVDAKTLGEPSFAAVKVYEVPNRLQRLFARSPLGRLRIFAGLQSKEDLLAAVIHDANGAIRLVSLADHPKQQWPIIADDLPGPDLDVWFLRATTIGNDFRGRTSRLDQAQADLEQADAEAMRAKEELEADLKDAESSDARGAKAIEKLMKAIKSTTNVLKKSEEVRQAEKNHSKASAGNQAAAQTEQTGSVRQAATQYFSAVESFESWALLFRELRTTSLLGVKIVHGRTTDIEIPSEPTKLGAVKS